MKNAAAREQRRIHRESPVNIPLVRHMLEDPRVRIVERSVDANWWYNTFRPAKLAGFNPFRDEIYVARESKMASWLRADPWGPSRRFNVHDLLMYEVMFAAHDYLHCWSARVVRSLAPHVGFGTADITSDNVDDLAFCHILTEACATVGLDYWYLATVAIDEVCDIGTDRFQLPLTVSFTESRLREYRRYNPSLSVQRVEFFEWLARFYCSGELWGFEPAALTESMLTRSWLSHEMKYGQTQRIYIRQWLQFMSGGRVPPYSEDALKEKLSTDTPWRVEIMKNLGQLLWEKIKEDKLLSDFEPLPKAGLWRAPPPNGPIDFRFTNLNALIARGLWDPKTVQVQRESFTIFAGQYASRYRFRDLPEEAHQLVASAAQRRDVAGLTFLLQRLTPLEPTDEPADLLFLN